MTSHNARRRRMRRRARMSWWKLGAMAAVSAGLVYAMMGSPQRVAPNQQAASKTTAPAAKITVHPVSYLATSSAPRSR